MVERTIKKTDTKKQEARTAEPHLLPDQFVKFPCLGFFSGIRSVVAGRVGILRSPAPADRFMEARMTSHRTGLMAGGSLCC